MGGIHFRRSPPLFYVALSASARDSDGGGLVSHCGSLEGFLKGIRENQTDEIFSPFFKGLKNVLIVIFRHAKTN